MNLLISSGYHLGRNMERRKKTINDTISTVDAVFLEERVSTITLPKKVKNWLLCPLLLSALRGYEGFLFCAGLIIPTDKELAEEVAFEHDVEIFCIDKSVHEVVAERWYLFGATNWALISIPALLVWLSPGSLAIWIVSIVMLGINSVACLSAFVAGTIQERNFHMLDQASSISEAEEIDSACLVTGGAHEEGLMDLAPRFDIDILEPKKSAMATIDDTI